MKVFVNDNTTAVDNDSTLDQLVRKAVTSDKGIAVAVNNSVIPRTEWSQTTLKESDKILIITATQGG